MDRICGAVLDKIYDLSPAGRYVIIAEDEFFEAFPDEYEKTGEALKKVLSSLRRGGYIDLKYSRGEMYCVAPLKGYAEEQITTPVPSKEQGRKSDLIFLSAFAGSALGSLIISLIFALI